MSSLVDEYKTVLLPLRVNEMDKENHSLVKYSLKIGFLTSCAFEGVKLFVIFRAKL